MTSAGLKLNLPGLSSGGENDLVVGGQIVAKSDNGRIVIIDPTGKRGPVTVLLPPRIRTPAERARLEPNTRFVGPTVIRWDERRHIFLGLTGLSSGLDRHEERMTENVVSEYFGDGQVHGQTPVGPASQTVSDIVVEPDGDRWGLTTYPVDAGENARLEFRLFPSAAPTRVTGGPVGPAAWSRDGETIAYGCVVPSGSPRLCLYDVRQRLVRPLLLPGIDAVGSPAWDADGRKLVVDGASGAPPHDVIATVDVDTGAVGSRVRDPRSKASPQWAPSGDDVIAFVAGTKVTLRSIDSGEEATVELSDAPATIEWVASTREEFGVS